MTLPKKRTTLTPVACDLCRRRKKKCDGARPICRPCQQQSIDTPCQYEELHRIKPLLNKIATLEAELSTARKQLPSAPNTDHNVAPSEDQSPAITQPCEVEAAIEADYPHKRQRQLHNAVHEEPSATLTGCDEGTSLPTANANVPSWTQDYNDPRDEHARRSSTSVQTSSLRCSTNDLPANKAGLQYSPSSVGAFGNLSMSSGIRCNFQSPLVQGTQLSNYALPVHNSTTLWLEPGQVRGDNIEWVNQTFCDMRSRGRWLAQQGVDASAIMGDTCPTLLNSFAPPQHQEGGAEFWTVSRWAARFVDSFPHLSLADRLACWIVMFVTFQWQICPNAETYRTIPEWYRPLPVQHFVPHMACLDILIWPSARTFLAKHPQDFIRAVMGTISVSWPHGDSGLFCTDMLTGKRQISPEFVAWCLNMSNWSVCDTSIACMPQLHGKIKIRQEPDPLAQCL